MKQQKKSHDQKSAAHKRFVRIFAIYALLLLSSTTLLLAVTSCQQAVQKQEAMPRSMVVEIRSHD